MISIIIPVYNGSGYLRRCLDSIVCQSFDDYEVIVVNDGSTDDTKEVLDDYARRYPKIKAVHKENEGVSTARNIGLEKANGEHIIFVDCDDYLSEDAFRIINDNLDDNTDIYIYNNLLVSSEGTKECVNSVSFSSVGELILETIEPLNKDRNEWLASVWAKVYGRKVLENVRFSESIHIGEDACFNIDCLEKVKDIGRIRIIPEMWYVYDRTNEGSATRKYKDNLYDSIRSQFGHFLKSIADLPVRNERQKKTALAKYCWKMFWILYYQGQLVKDDDRCFLWYKDTAAFINENDIGSIDFEDQLMNRSFKYRKLLNNELLLSGFRKLYLSGNGKRNV